MAGKIIFMKRSLLITFLLLFSFSLAKAQFYTKDYKPLKYGGSCSRPSYETFFKKNSFQFNTTDRSIVKKYKDYLYFLQLSYAKACKDKSFIDESFMKNYFQKMLDTVLHANDIKDKIQVVITRSAVPNAYNMGDNKLFLNIGLLKHIETEAEIAFVLCHELSHQLLHHVEDNFIAAELRAKDRALKKEIRDIKKAKYNKLDMSVQLLKGINYDFAKFSRANERQADSMALILLNKTPYALGESIRMMKILEHIEEDSTIIDYGKYFETKDSYMDDAWLAKRPARIDFGQKDIIELDKDSMKTHPDVPNRIKMLEDQLKAMKSSDADRLEYWQPKSTLDSIIFCSAFEEIEMYNKNKRYGAVVYHSLALLNELPENTYLYKKVAVSMNQLVKKVKEHTIQNFIPIESKDLPEAYNQFLRIIDRTTDEEVLVLFKNFLSNHYSKMSSDPEIQTIYNEINKKK